MKKFSKILGIVCLIFFINIFYWRASHFALAYSAGDSRHNITITPAPYTQKNHIVEINYYDVSDGESAWACFTPSGEWSGAYSNINGTMNFDVNECLDNMGDYGNIRFINFCLACDYSDCYGGADDCKNSAAYRYFDYTLSYQSSKYLSINPASTTDIMASTKSVVSDVWQIIALAMGVPTAFFAIKGVLSLFKR